MKIKTEMKEIEVSYNKETNNAPKIQSSQDAYRVLRPLFDDSTITFYEEFFVLFLDRKNSVIGYRMIGRGGVAGCVVDAKVIFGIALKCVCSSIILSHNHPSDNLKPSSADIQLTKKLKQSGKMLDVAVLDHLIITASGYYSFADEGMI